MVGYDYLFGSVVNNYNNQRLKGYWLLLMYFVGILRACRNLTLNVGLYAIAASNNLGQSLGSFWDPDGFVKWYFSGVFAPFFIAALWLEVWNWSWWVTEELTILYIEMVRMLLWPHWCRDARCLCITRSRLYADGCDWVWMPKGPPPPLPPSVTRKSAALCFLLFFSLDNFVCRFYYCTEMRNR